MQRRVTEHIGEDVTVPRSVLIISMYFAAMNLAPRSFAKRWNECAGFGSYAVCMRTRYATDMCTD